MVTRSLLDILLPGRTARPDAVNDAGGAAYLLSAEHALAQYAATGTLAGTYYARAEVQTDAVIALCGCVAPEFIARTALYARLEAHQRDLPALLCAVLSVLSPGLLAEVFDRVIDTPRMLRTFVRIMRSGVVARRSLGTLPQRLVRDWLEARTDEQLFVASVGQDPSLADIVRMVHPRPTTASRSALYAFLIGRPHDRADLPPLVRAVQDFNAGRTDAIPDVPFQMLTGTTRGPDVWRGIARNGSWRMVRMNLNTFARHGVFEDPATVRAVAATLRDPDRMRRARPRPYELMIALRAAGDAVPHVIRAALEHAMEQSIASVPMIPGRVAVAVDVSYSMHDPITGWRGSRSSSVRCVDVAALMTAAILRRNPTAIVLPFSDGVLPVRLSRSHRVARNAERLAALPGGGTDCSAPLRELERRRVRVDTVVMISDQESWIDTTPESWRNGTGTLQAWDRLRAGNRGARLVCIDLQPIESVQAPPRPDILHVGGFNDAVFDVVADFAAGRSRDRHHWVRLIEAVSI